MKYESEALKVIHEGAVDKFKAGVISETRMREYDEMCLANPKLKQKSVSVCSDEKSVSIGHISTVSA